MLAQVKPILAQFDNSICYWIAVPNVAANGQFTLNVSVLVWHSTDQPTRRQIRKALKEGLTTDVLWACVREQGYLAEHVTDSVRLIVHVNSNLEG